MDSEKDADFKIGACIRSWRKKRNLLQKELAARLNMNVTQLWSIENDRNSPSMRTVSRIASALGVALPRFLAQEDDLPGEKPHSTAAKAASEPPCAVVHAGDADFVPLMREGKKQCVLPQATMKYLSRKIEEAMSLESEFNTSMPSTLPLSLPISKSEAGARRLAFALRAHCDLGSAILHDALSVFEPYGISIIEATLPDDCVSSSFYCPQHRNFTVFLSSSLRGDRMRSRRQFSFLSETGKMFLFAGNGFKTYRETDTSRRFIHHFAATFLLPETAVTAIANSLKIGRDDWTWKLLLRIKQRFGVSAEVFNIRLKELGLISRRLHELFYKKIKAHYKKNKHSEPYLELDEMSYRLGDLKARKQ